MYRNKSQHGLLRCPNSRPGPAHEGGKVDRLAAHLGLAISNPAYTQSSRATQIRARPS